MSPDDSRIDAGMAAGFRRKPPTDSVLAAIERATGRPASIRIEETPGDGAAWSGLGDADGPRYETVREIARGGVGVVYRSHDSDLGRDVAMKVLREGLDSNPDIVQRFVDEAQIGGQLQHPGIVPVYELGLNEEERPFFTMKLIKGRTLAAILKMRSSPADERRRLVGIFERVCQTISYAHARGVIHRDLKPSNIMIGAFGEVQVVDWGFAKVLARGGVADEDAPSPPPPDLTVIRSIRTDSDTGSQAGSVMGTPSYMPPEQAWGDIARLDERSDVFALGAVLCEILTGLPPYPNKADLESPIMRAAQGDLEDAYARLAECGAEEELTAIARECLTKERAGRPRDAGVVAQRVQAHLNGIEERARAAEVAAVEARAQASAQRRARRLTVALAVTACVALMAAGGGYWWHDRQSRDEVARHNAAVRALGADARRLEKTALARDTAAAWDAAAAGLKRALELAATGETDAELRGALVKRQAAAAMNLQAVARREHQERLDRRILERLQELRVARADMRSENVVAGRHYAEAFRDYGIDLDALTDEEFKDAIQSRAIRRQLADGLDTWALVEGGLNLHQSRRGQRLFDLVMQIDDDPWRNALRRAMIDRDPDTLKELTQNKGERYYGTNAPNFLAHGLKLVGERDLSRDVLKDALKRRPDGFWLNMQLGWEMYAESPPRYDEALRYHRASRAVRPNSASAVTAVAHTLDRLGETDASIEAWEDLQKALPGVWNVYMPLMDALHKAGRLAAMMPDLQQAAEDNPNDALVHFKLGAAMFGTGNGRRAIPHLKRAVDIEPLSFRGHRHLARAYEADKQYDKAVTHYKRALEMQPEWAYCRISLASVYLKIHELEKARLEYEAVQQKFPVDTDFCINYGLTLSLTGQSGRAEDAFREAARLQPLNHIPHVNLSAIYVERRDYSKAIASAREALKLKPAHPRASSNLGRALMSRGEWAEALTYLRRASTEEDWLFGVDYMAGFQAELCDQAPDWEERLPQVLRGQLDPEDELETAGYAAVCYYRERYADAVKLYHRALEIESTLFDWPERFDGYLAACAAVRASAETSGPQARSLREFALECMKARLAVIGAQLDENFATERAIVRKKILWWKRDRQLEAVRGGAIERLPTDEQEQWREFWAAVDAAFERARE